MPAAVAVVSLVVAAASSSYSAYVANDNAIDAKNQAEHLAYEVEKSLKEFCRCQES